MECRLDGRVALVTGASKGIGLAITAAFSAAGARVVMVARHEAGLREAAATVPGPTAIVVANVGDPDAAEHSVRAAIEEFGSLDILVNNAATNPYFGPMLDIDAERFDKTVAVNLRGPLLWAQAAWHQAFRARPGVVVNVSSSGSLRATPGIGAYNVTKAALNQLTRQLAHEMAPTRVVGIAPGLIRTDMSQALIERDGGRRAQRLPVGRIGEPEDVASFVTFLVSDQASFTTGETYLLDGGVTAVPLDG